MTMATTEEVQANCELGAILKKKPRKTRYGSARLQITYSACEDASTHEVMWLNEGSGLLHPLNSRWDAKTLIGRYVRLDEILDNGCRKEANGP